VTYCSCHHNIDFGNLIGSYDIHSLFNSLLTGHNDWIIVLGIKGEAHGGLDTEKLR
jgi:hypothetical protein